MKHLDLDRQLQERWSQFSEEVESLIRSRSYSLSKDNLPCEPGVYLITNKRMNVYYAGKATRSLRDRVLNKHISGDESHAIQRAYMGRYPDRRERRAFIKDNFRVKWLTIKDPIKLADLERLIIWLLRPKFNRA